ncbi:MAG: transcriptional regulator [halophilic archaeon J07HB67]|jgi:AsnC family.|nr:MAG: transcriptional regulator [halophilic archaeon J07HB67]
MVKAYVMIRVEAGVVGEVADRVRDLAAVAEGHAVAGDYDVVAEVVADEMYQAMETVADQIHDLDGTTETKTYICLD